MKLIEADIDRVVAAVVGHPQSPRYREVTARVAAGVPRAEILADLKARPFWGMFAMDGGWTFKMQRPQPVDGLQRERGWKVEAQEGRAVVRSGFVSWREIIDRIAELDPEPADVGPPNAFADSEKWMAANHALHDGVDRQLALGST